MYSNDLDTNESLILTIIGQGLSTTTALGTVSEKIFLQVYCSRKTKLHGGA